MKSSFFPRRRLASGFTLVEILIAAATLAMLALIAVPGALRAHKRSQATRVLNDLRLIDNALEHWASEAGRASGEIAGFSNPRPFIKADTQFATTGAGVFGSAFGQDFAADSFPAKPHATRDSLSDGDPASFREPYRF